MDFASFGVGSKSSMRRKQSNSLLQALGKSTTTKSTASRVSAIPMPHPSQTPNSHSSNSHSDESYGQYTPDDSYSAYSYNPTASRAASISASTAKGGRSVSGATTSGASTYTGGHGSVREVKKLEDVIGLAKDRLLNWSYLMQWYGGDTHWLNTVKVRRELVEKELGPGKLDLRARNYFILGTSLAMLFDITVASDFLRALTRLLEEWEYYCEKGGKTMKGLFKGQKGKNKSDTLEAEPYLVFLNLPFTPDFFAVHATTCSVIRDIYKKIMGMLLPNIHAPLPIGTAPPPKPLPDFTDTIPSQSLLHPSTFIFSAPTETVLRANPQLSNSVSQFSSQESMYNGHSGHGSAYSTPTAYHYSMESPGPRNGRETPFGESAAGFAPENGPVQHDAFEAFVNGDLPASHCLIGDGQQVTPQIIDTFVKVDAKLKKQFNLLLKEGDQFARKTLDDEIAMLLSSLNGAAPLQFDYNAAMSGAGNGWLPSPSSTSRTPPPNSASTANFSISATTQSIPRRHPGVVRAGSSGDSAGMHGKVRAGSNSSHGHGQGPYEYSESIDEEVVRDEDEVDERKERDFGTV